MKLLALLLILPAFGYSQITLKYDSLRLPPSNYFLKQDGIGHQFNLNMTPKYPARDTLACYFLEADDTQNELFTIWISGYVIRENGMFTFRGLDKNSTTQVAAQYLPITAGVLKNQLLYGDKATKVTTTVIQLILKPTN